MNPSSVTFGDTSSSEEVNTFGEISMNIDEIKLLDIQPSQFYISEEKLSGVKSWFDPNDLSNFEPLPIFEHGGKIFFTDGHTRALAAFLSGIEKVPLVWDSEEEIGIKEYEICVKACENRGIKNIADLEHRVLSHDEYVAKWDNWCDGMQEAVLYFNEK